MQSLFWDNKNGDSGETGHPIRASETLIPLKSGYRAWAKRELEELVNCQNFVQTD